MGALVMCSPVGSSTAVAGVESRPGVEQRPCQGACNQMLWVAPSSLKIPGATFMCNDCGKAALAAQIVADPKPVRLRLAPGALAAPEDRRRRNELEARGFRDTSPEEIEEMKRR